MFYTINDYREAKTNCTNLDNFGGSCYETCRYRDNGMCELSKIELTNLCLEELLGVDTKAHSSNFAWNLLTIVDEKHNKQQNIRKAIISGSFDPFTNGHLELVKQASKMFDEKPPLLTTKVISMRVAFHQLRLNI